MISISAPLRVLIACEVIASVFLLLLGLDMYAHHRVEDLGGVNVWGYRGRVARARQPNEIRVAVIGGTRAHGWGQTASAMTNELRRIVMLTTDQKGGEIRPVTVINLGQLGALPDSYVSRTEHFAYLAPDYICLYDDLGVRGLLTGSAPSGIYELTGYSPILPLVLREKAELWKTTPPTSPRRLAGPMLERVASGIAAADQLLLRSLPERDARVVGDADSMTYVDTMMRAIQVAHRHARGVVVALSPAETEDQLHNATAFRARLETEFGSAPWLRLVDLGSEARLLDRDLRLDGWNYGGDGTALVARTIAPALLSLITAH